MYLVKSGKLLYTLDCKIKKITIFIAMIINQLIERALPKLGTTSTTSTLTSSTSITSTYSTNLISGTSGSSSSSSSSSTTNLIIPTITPPSSNDNPYVFHSKDAPLQGTLFIAMGSIIFSIFLICGIWWIISTYLQIHRTRSFNDSQKYNSLLHTHSNDNESTDGKPESDSSSDIDIEKQINSFKQPPKESNDSLFQIQNLFVSPTVAITKISQTQRDSMISLTSVPYKGMQPNDLDTNVGDATCVQPPGSMVSLLSPLQSPSNSKYYSYQSQLKPQLNIPGSNNRRSKVPSMYLDELLQGNT